MSTTAVKSRKRKTATENEVTPSKSPKVSKEFSKKRKPGSTFKSKQKGHGKPLPKETAQSRKDRKHLRKKGKPLFELSVKAKQIWEKLRIQKNRLSPEEKIALVEELMELVVENNKKLINLAYAHDTSRVIQTCLKQGSKEQRQKIFTELNDHIVEMCKKGYAKNLVWKMLKYGTTEERGVVMASFKNEACKLLRHSKSAGVIEYAYNNYATAPQRDLIISQLYGNVYRLCKTSDSDTLAQVMEREPEKRVSILQSFKKALLPLVEKSGISLTITHKAFYDFFQHCDDQSIRAELIEAVRESLVHMMHTHDGAHVAMNCLWYGTKKDRKVIIKSMKEFVLKLCCEEFGILPLLAAFDCVDDTVFINKALVTPIVNGIDDVLHNKYGRKVLLYLMSPRNSSHFLPETVKFLSKGDDNPTSKKPMAQRHQELSATASPAIVEYVAANAEKLIFDRSLFLIVEAAILHCHSDTDTTPLINALLEIIDRDFEPGEKDKNGQFHIVEDPSGHLLIKQIITAESKAKERNADLVSKFSQALLKDVSRDNLTSWSACNRGTLILLALVESSDADISQQTKLALKKKISVLKRNSSVKSTKILLQKLK